MTHNNTHLHTRKKYTQQTAYQRYFGKDIFLSVSRSKEAVNLQQICDKISYSYCSICYLTLAPLGGGQNLQKSNG